MYFKEFLQRVDFSVYWNYAGSLTKPPCQEDIKWTVIRDVQSLSKEQLKRLQIKMANKMKYAGGTGNNREIQPLNRRTLYFSKATKIQGVIEMLIAFVLMSAILL